MNKNILHVLRRPAALLLTAALSVACLAGCGSSKNDTRCPECMEICREKAPKMTELSPGHWLACHRA